MQGQVPEGGRSDHGEDPPEVGQKAEKSCDDYGPLADKPGFLVFRETLPANSPGLQRQRALPVWSRDGERFVRWRLPAVRF